jgi:hypothetical protein
MIKRTLSTTAAIFAVCLSLGAQEEIASRASQPAGFELRPASPSDIVEHRAASGQAGFFRTLNNTWYASGPLMLADARLFSFPQAFGWVEATPGEFLPAFTPGELPRMTSVPSTVRDSASKPVDLLHKFDYVGGEVGVFYGRSTGKVSREVEQGYILGQVIDGNTQITVGGSYQHVRGSVPRR